MSSETAYEWFHQVSGFGLDEFLGSRRGLDLGIDIFELSGVLLFPYLVDGRKISPKLFYQVSVPWFEYLIVAGEFI